MSKENKQMCKDCQWYYLPKNWPVKYSDPNRRLCCNKKLMDYLPKEYPISMKPDFGCRFFKKKDKNQAKEIGKEFGRRQK